jgi:hypothetical protein
VEPTQFIASNTHSLRLRHMAASAVCLAFISGLASAAPQAALNVKARAQASYGKLPLSFEANRGQTDALVKFLARGQGYALFLTPNGAVLSLKKPKVKINTSALTKSASSSEISSSILQMHLVEANSAPKVVGKEALPGRVNYLIGKDPSRWRTQVPTYGKVAYEDVYPGVDLVYYGNQGQLEYDFVLAPGADPHNIKLAFKGSSHIEVSPAGELVLRMANGDIRMHKPVIYQQIEGVRQPIAGSYALKADQTVGFQVAAYDTVHPLVIDPVLVYSTYLGGGANDEGYDIAVDPQGQAYVIGKTESLDFPTIGAPQATFHGGDAHGGDVFIAKLNRQGSALVYATYLGGSGGEIGHSIAVDPQGQAVVTGSTGSRDFPTKNAMQPVFGGDTDAFVAQLSADGSALDYSTYLGGIWHDEGLGIAMDQLGRAYVTGSTNSPDFPTRNALQPLVRSYRYSDAFVARFTTNGALVYSTYLGGSENDLGTDIAVDSRGQAYVTGITEGFPTKNAAQSAFGGGEFDAFVVKLSADGGTLHYSTHLGGNEEDFGRGIAVDLRGQAYVTGTTNSDDFPTKNAVQPVFGGPGGDVGDAFVAQLSADGSALNYSTYLGGKQFDYGEDIAVNLQGQAVVTGSTNSSDFPTRNALQSALTGGTNAFVAQFTADGMTLRYSTYGGGSVHDEGSGIAVDPLGQVYVTGSTSSDDFPIEKALQPVLTGGTDAFVAKIRNDSQP